MPLHTYRPTMTWRATQWPRSPREPAPNSSTVTTMARHVPIATGPLLVERLRACVVCMRCDPQRPIGLLVEYLLREHHHSATKRAQPTKRPTAGRRAQSTTTTTASTTITAIMTTRKWIAPIAITPAAATAPLWMADQERQQQQ